MTLPPIRRLVARYSAPALTAAATAIAVVASLLLGALLALLLKGRIPVMDLVMSAVIPAIVAPLVVHGFVRLLRELESAERQLRVLAAFDPLTHAHNRRHLLELAGGECQRAARYGRPLALLMIDVDHFKAVNDTYGHTAGDDTLRAVAGACRATLRGSDLLARYGGDEFVVLLPETDAGSAAELADRLRGRVEAARTKAGGREIAVTVSVGVAGFDPTADFDRMLAAADRALYRAKSGGRNRVAAADAPAPP